MNAQLIIKIIKRVVLCLCEPARERGRCGFSFGRRHCLSKVRKVFLLSFGASVVNLLEFRTVVIFWGLFRSGLQLGFQRRDNPHGRIGLGSFIVVMWKIVQEYRKG